jgi:hypothetical protein
MTLSLSSEKIEQRREKKRKIDFFDRKKQENSIVS